MIALLAALALAVEPADTRWQTLETRRFVVHYPESRRDPSDRRWFSAEDAAIRTAWWAEQLWLPLSDAVGWFPRQRTHIVLVDHTDDLVGYAQPAWRRVVLSTQPGSQLTRLRGGIGWTEDGLAHELGHLWTHEASGAVAQPDSYGFEVGSLGEVGPVSLGGRLVLGPNAPFWWSEGAAEYAAERAGFSAWGPARDRTLRAAARDDRLLEWDALQREPETQADAERAYQQGYAFARWLDATHGRGTFDRIGRRAASRYRLDWDRLVRQVTGEPARVVHERHLEDLRARYQAQIEARLALGVVEGRELDGPFPWEIDALPIADRWATLDPDARARRRDATGSWTLHPRWSSDGRWLAEHRAGWIRVAPVDERALDALFPGAAPDQAARRRSESVWIPSAFGHPFALVPGEDALILVAPAALARSPLAPDDGRHWNQVYRLDLSGAMPRVLSGARLRSRLTPIPGTLRAHDPAVSPDGRRLAWLEHRDGSVNLVVSDLSGEGRRALTAFDEGTRLQGPSWSPDGERIVVALRRTGQQNLWIVHVDSGALEPLTQDAYEEQDPWWADDGVYFAADVDDVFDVFRIDPETRAAHRLTRVLGGAATPSLTPSGHLLFARYDASGWKSVGLPREDWLFEPVDAFPPPDPDEAARDLAFRPVLDEAIARRRPYRAFRALLPPAVAPILRVDAHPRGARGLGGFYLKARDAVERQHLVLHALVGDDLLATGAWTWRGWRPELTVYGGHERASYGRVGGVDRRLDQGGLTVELPWRYGVSLRANGEVSVAQAGPVTLSSGRLTGGLVLGDSWALRKPEARGAAARIEAGIGQSRVQGAPGWGRYPLVQARGAGSLVLGGPRTAHRLELGGQFAWTDRDLHPLEELRAGGDHPYALRLGALEPTAPFPGYAPYSLAGEVLAIGTVGWRLPLWPELDHRAGPLWLDRLDARLAADAGQVLRHGEPFDGRLLADVVGELRLSAELLDRPWNSFVAVAWPLVDPEGSLPTVDMAPWIATVPGPRIYVGIGTGW